MLSYELCEELKDAGFPQECKKGDAYYCFGNLEFCGEDDYEDSIKWISGLKDTTDCKVPSLSELISACGNRFHFLKRGTKQIGGKEISDWWYATALVDNGEAVPIADGSTPERAVARLWLALNKK